jgi:hypothetical protein
MYIRFKHRHCPCNEIEYLPSCGKKQRRPKKENEQNAVGDMEHDKNDYALRSSEQIHHKTRKRGFERIDR